MGEAHPPVIHSSLIRQGYEEDTHSEETNISPKNNSVNVTSEFGPPKSTGEAHQYPPVLTAVIQAVEHLDESVCFLCGLIPQRLEVRLRKIVI